MNAKAKDVAFDNLYGKDGLEDEYFNMTKYMTDAARTAPDNAVFHDELVSSRILQDAIADVMILAPRVDQIKKALYYGKDTDELAFSRRVADHKDYGNVPHELIHAILGMFTEATELLELLDILIRNKDGFPSPEEEQEFWYNMEKALTNESGDVMWYQALLFKYLGTNFERVGELNIAKLRKRFPVKFSEELAVNRDEAVENVVFE